MTLFRQIALLLSIFLIILLTTVLTLNFKSANHSVQERLYEDAKNTATSLSLSLGSANGDISMMSTMINANFDSGNYHYISLSDIDGNIVYERKNESEHSDVPKWFLDIVDIDAPIASANVSAGWSPIGILDVQSDTTYAYNQLYSILKGLTISFSILAICALVLLGLLLHIILKPLKRVQQQAEAVIRNEFIIQEEIPYTKEFRDVVLGMNSMVKKVKAMFDKGNEELKRHKEMEYIDQTTRLKNRKYLIDKLPAYLKSDASSKGGINMMISLSGVIEANEQIGHKNVDELFIEIANIFTLCAQEFHNSIVARMNGTEFAILLPECSNEKATQLAQNIYDSVNNTITAHELSSDVTFISIGICEYNYKQSVSQLLSLSDNALAQAKFHNVHIHLEPLEDDKEIMGKDAWRKTILEAIDTNSFSLVAYKAIEIKTKKVAHNVLSISMHAHDGNTYSYGQFMALANQTGLGEKVYKVIIQKVFKTPDQALKGSICSLRLSCEYLKLSSTYDELSKLFATYASKLPFKIIIEMPDRILHKHLKLAKLYKKLFEKYHIDMGVYEFIGESEDYRYLQELRPSYIKGEADYFLTQSEQALSALRLITDTVGISLIATGVNTQDALPKLLRKDILIVQGKITEVTNFKGLDTSGI